MLCLTKKMVVGLLAALACVAFVGSEARAGTERFAVFAVKNDTGNVTINFQIKIGNGPWTSYSVAPGQARTFWHEFKNRKDRSYPVTKIRFNSAIDNNTPFTIEYDLSRYAAPDKFYKYAKQYSFQKNDDNYFDLFSNN